MGSVLPHWFARFGRGVYRHRIGIILVWAVVILACMPFIADLMTPFQSTGFTAERSKSAAAERYLGRHLGYNKNQFIVIYHSQSLLATDAAYIKKLKKSLSGLKELSLDHEVILPEANSKQISKDKHTAYAAILFKDNAPMSDSDLDLVRKGIKKPQGMSMRIGGEAIFVDGINQQTQKDLYKADFIAAPASVITLILVFGTLVAAFVPMVLGGGCALIILTTLYILGHVFSLSIFTLNIALLLGLCLSLDYALFMIYRFRDELRQPHQSILEVIERTLSTAGRAVFFSGLAVFISLSALLFFPINILFSLGIGGLVAVFVAVAVALTLLPALLAVLGEGINRFRVFSGESGPSWCSWHAIALQVIRHPFLFFFSALVILVWLSHPLMNVRFGISDYQILPKHTESYEFIEAYQQAFDKNELTPIVIVVKAKRGDILSSVHLSQLHLLAERLKRNPLVECVNSLVTTTPELQTVQYEALYHLPHSLMTKPVQQLLRTTTEHSFTVMQVISKYDSNSPETLKLVEQLRDMNPGKGLTLRLTGIPVNNADVMQTIAHVFPYAVAWVMGLTYFILLLLLRSLFLPFKAIVMNVLSLCASYGVLVFVFQEGHLHQLLNFNPQGMLDISLLIIIFCALFGFSMDYEVFLLTRIKECHDATHDNDKSIVFGIEHSGRIITSAAMIVIMLCGSFMVADVIMVKAFGLGIAIAVFVDAFIIRSLLVPAIMGLMKEWNWYLPRWLDRVLPGK